MLGLAYGMAPADVLELEPELVATMLDALEERAS
jgi:hypothetical protein